MFKSVEARYALRSVLVGLIAAATSLQAQLPFDYPDLYQALLAGVLGGAAYAGIGAATPQVEPNVGVKGEPL